MPQTLNVHSHVHTRNVRNNVHSAVPNRMHSTERNPEDNPEDTTEDAPVDTIENATVESEYFWINASEIRHSNFRKLPLWANIFNLFFSISC